MDNKLGVIRAVIQKCTDDAAAKMRESTSHKFQNWVFDSVRAILQDLKEKQLIESYKLKIAPSFKQKQENLLPVTVDILCDGEKAQFEYILKGNEERRRKK